MQILHVELAELAGPGNEEVHDSADRGVVVQTDEGVHLLRALIALQQNLNHDEANALKNDAAHLEDEADPRKLDLAERGERHTGYDEKDVVKGLHRGFRDAPDPANDENGDGRAGLEHLNERDR